MRAPNTPVTSWKDKRVWVIGASSGIGAAVAQRLLQEGARVVLSARRHDQLLVVAADHPQAAVIDFDVTDAAAWSPAMSRAIQFFGGGIDLVVMGAARYDPSHSWELELGQVEKSFDLNVVSVYRGLSVLVPELVQAGAGGIALIGSVSAYTGLPRALIYGATKAALNNLAQTLYFELAPKGLSVYLINPGFVQTPMTAVNDFKMPGLMTPEAAASAIIQGIEKGKFEINFPRGFATTLRVLSWMPDRIRFALLHKITGM